MEHSDYAVLVAEGNSQFREEVVPAEMEEIRARRRARAEALGLALPTDEAGAPESDLVGIALSGGGTLWYPAHGDLPEMTGYLLYFKPSITGDEDEIVNEYRADSPEFPHESTADQMFGEGQFEAYRALGSHLAEGAFAARPAVGRAPGATEAWFRGLAEAIASEKKA